LICKCWRKQWRYVFGTSRVEKTD